MEFEKEIILIKSLSAANHLFEEIKSNTNWDNSMVSRKTVSYGIPYNYSNMMYLKSAIPGYLEELRNIVSTRLGFLPNNCLINYYSNGHSKMGFHSDQVNQLVKDTGIAIFSLGNTRIIRFRDKTNKEFFFDITLDAGTLLYMSQGVQNRWMHAILPDKKNSQSERISITFRKLVEVI